MRTNLVYVTYESRLNNLISLVNHVAPFIVSDFWVKVQATPSLDAAHFTANFDECELSYKVLFDCLVDQVNASLSPDKASEFLHRSDMYKTHCEVAQASMLEPHEEQAQWAIWEREDQRSAEDERIALYHNEY